MLLPPPQIPGPRALVPNQRAFSLVELLVVMGIIGLLLALVLPAVISRSGSGDLTKSTFQLAGALDAARADAMARNAYRYVAVEPDEVNGSAVIRLKTLGYRTGGRFPSDGGAVFVPLNPTTILNNLRITCFDKRKPPVRTAADQKLAVLAPEDPGEEHAFTRTVTADGLKNAFLFELSSNGEVHLVDPGSPADSPRVLSRWIEIGLQSTRGTTIPAATDNGNRAAVQVAGLTGQTQIYRPQ